MSMGAELAVILKARDEASKVMRGVGTEGTRLGSVFGKVGGALSSVASTAAGFVLGGGFLALPGLLMDAGQAAADDAASVAMLRQAVENSGASWEKYGGTLEDVIDAGINLGFADDAQRRSLSLLVAQTGSAEEAQKRMALAMDFSRGANIDLETASKLLGKVTDENVNVLSRYGISMKAGASEAELFGALQQKFGGQAQTFAQSNAGLAAAAKLQMGELKEMVGGFVLPIFGALASFTVKTLVPALKTLAAPISLIGSTAIAIATGGGFDLLYSAISGVFGPRTTGLIAAFIDPIARFRVDVLPGLIDTFWSMVAAVQPFIAQAIDIGSRIIPLVVAAVQPFIAQAVDIGSRVIPIVTGAFAALVEKLTPFVEKAIELGSRVVPAAIEAIRNLVAQGAGLVTFFKDNQFAAEALAATLASLATKELASLILEIPTAARHLVILASAFWAHATAAGAAAVATALALLPFIALTVVFAAVILAGIQIVKNWDLIKFAAETLAAFVGQKFSDLGTAIMNAVQTVIDVLTTMRDHWDTIFGFMAGRVLRFIGESIDSIGEWIDATWSAFRQWSIDALTAVGQFADAAPARLLEFALAGGNIIGRFAIDFILAVNQWRDDAVAGFAAFALDAIAAIGSFIRYVEGLPGVMWDKALEIASNFWEGFKAGLGISSPSFVELAFMAMSDAAAIAAEDIAADVGGMQAHLEEMAVAQTKWEGWVADEQARIWDETARLNREHADRRIAEAQRVAQALINTELAIARIQERAGQEEQDRQRQRRLVQFVETFAADRLAAAAATVGSSQDLLMQAIGQIASTLDLNLRIGNVSLGQLLSQMGINVNLPTFAAGGIVPGPIGSPRLAVVHGGERVSPVGGSGTSITVNVTGNVYGVEDLERAVAAAWTKAARGGAFGFAGI